jgi:hypothetical protein
MELAMGHQQQLAKDNFTVQLLAHKQTGFELYSFVERHALPL